jgi:hypothetical protein
LVAELGSAELISRSSYDWLSWMRQVAANIARVYLSDPCDTGVTRPTSVNLSFDVRTQPLRKLPRLEVEGFQASGREWVQLVDMAAGQLTA